MLVERGAEFVCAFDLAPPPEDALQDDRIEVGVLFICPHCLSLTSCSISI